MTIPSSIEFQPDPARDLVLERVVDVPPERAFAAWTDPAHLVHWFTPKPWETVAAEVDLRPGGVFSTTMRSPEGQEFTNAGCVLDVVPNRRFVWTGGLQPGYRPRTKEETAQVPFLFTAVLTFEPDGAGTRYRALAIHPDEAARKTHEGMGFVTGWGKALDQLVEYMKTVEGRPSTVDR